MLKIAVKTFHQRVDNSLGKILLQLDSLEYMTSLDSNSNCLNYNELKWPVWGHGQFGGTVGNNSGNEF